MPLLTPEQASQRMKELWRTHRHEMLQHTEKAHAALRGKTGDKCHNWIGGSRIHRGYRFLYSGHQTPKYIREHILVMEQHLGRALEHGEVIHNINGDRLDNLIENLELHTSSTHKRLHDAKRHMESRHHH